ncbi:DEAD/DEAH box helicase [Aurantiacibacter luteus]|uniref:Transcription-repair-coupling factor n=2 Tax=Aurantiacibacter luteus TaxID=1581420 RepID=A0A0G9MYV8_9SPHN|nr:DEAD/DEAH box helicase [Aurantiacibacter luteus]
MTQIQSTAHHAAFLADAMEAGPVVYAAPDEASAMATAELLRQCAPDATVVHVPATDALPGEDAPASAVNIGQRVAALRQVGVAMGEKAERIALVTSGEALAYAYAPPGQYIAAPPEVAVGARIDLEALAEELEQIGYRSDERVDEPGEFGLHGQVLDVFPVDAQRPVRVETSKGAVVAIRSYDAIDQLTLADLDSCLIGRAAEPEPGSEPVPLTAHLPTAQLTITPAADKARRAMLRLVADAGLSPAQGVGLATVSEKDWKTAREAMTALPIDPPQEIAPRFVEDDEPAMSAQAFVAAQRAAGRRVLVLAGQRDLRFLQRQMPEPGKVEIFATWAEARASDAPFGALAVCADRGFVTDRLCIIAGADLLGGRAQRRGDSVSAVSSACLFALSDIHLGDVVVHEEHGLALVSGIVPMPSAGDGEAGDALQLTFAKDTVRLVPVAELDRIWRYGAEPEAVTLDTLNGTSWTRRRAKIEAAMAQTAQQLVAMAAERAGREAPVLDPPVDAYERFCAGFAFSETADQLRAIEAVRDDLASGRPMDRLVVGDVGYGKTEIALRAAVIAALSGHQVAVAAPTSVLARQHYETFRQRFADSGVDVAMLSRLTTPAEAKRVKEGLADGTIAVVVGTGAVAGAGMTYASLALVVIDEEQRFGSKDKDRLRELSAGHSLSLSATPIPRSLQSALIGLQDLSVLATPPARRQPIATRIVESDDALLRSALLGEKARKGQSFVVVPRIADIDPLARRLAKLVPELSVITVHGCMKAAEIDEAMVGFATGQGDVLLATNIIEAGLDVPRANTMIVLDADRFGLSQLHQLRGRVGRGRRRGTIVLMTDPGRELAPHTVKRLGTLAAFDTLGAGFAISARDLDLRGSGDLAGDDQTGHMKLIGGDLYQFLLEQAVRTARGEAVPERWTPRLNAGIEGSLPAEWVGEDDIRIGLYARAARIASQGELRAFTSELRDRFGRLPAKARLFVRMVQVRLLAKRAGIARIDAGPGAIALNPRPGKDITSSTLLAKQDRLILNEKIADPDDRLKRTQQLLREL